MHITLIFNFLIDILEGKKEREKNLFYKEKYLYIKIEPISKKDSFWID